MKLKQQVFEIAQNATEQFKSYAAKATAIASKAAAAAAYSPDAARQRVLSAAATMEALKQPVETLADAGHRLNGLAHHFAERVLTQQANMIKGLAHDGSQRLRLLAKAQGVKPALDQQLAYFDVTRDRVLRDMKQSYAIVTEAGRGAAQIAVKAYGALKPVAGSEIPAAKAPASKARRAPKAAKPTGVAKQAVKRRKAA